jgi:hypothetical protein
MVQVVTTQAGRLKADRLKEKISAVKQNPNRLEPLADDGVMDDPYCPSAFSLTA